MSNQGNYHKVDTNIILNDTIIDADIKTTAAIQRSKMKEADDLNIKTGKILKIFGAGDVKYLELKHDDTNTIITSSAGYVRLASATGMVAAFNTGIVSFFRAYSSNSSNHITMKHDATDGIIETSVGLLKLNPATDIHALQNLYVRDGKELHIFDSGNSGKIVLKHSGSHSLLYCNTGNLYIYPDGGGVILAESGVNNFIDLLGSGGSNKVTVKSDNTDGIVETNSGDIKFNPSGDVNANNNIIKGINSLTYQAAKTGYVSIEPYDLNPVDSSDAYDTGLGFRAGCADTGACTLGVGVRLPHGVTVTSLKAFWYRDDAAAAGSCNLYRHARSNSDTRQTMASAASNATSGDHTVEDTSISNAVVDLTSYGYYVEVLLNPNDAITDVKICGILITYTKTSPLT